MKKILAYDLGTSGLKTVLFDGDGRAIASTYRPYPTYYPRIGWHEQRPEDWWKAVVETTRELMRTTGEDPRDIVCMAISSHSFGVVPVDIGGTLLLDQTMLWSDTRAGEMAPKLLEHVSFDDWYLQTGGNVPGIHPLFKQLWIQKYDPETYRRADKFLGTKDYINYKLTGIMATDHSYASGTAMYDLRQSCYAQNLMDIVGLDREKQPQIVPSTSILGTLTSEAAQALGLTKRTVVAAGGVDNSCMALGARGIRNGRVYTNLGSSAWIAVTADKPLLSLKSYPNTFAHVLPGLYNSAVTIFAACGAYRWLRDAAFTDLLTREEAGGESCYTGMNRMAEQSPVGANKLLFDPTLSGGCHIDYSQAAKGSFMGLDIKHTRGDMARAVLEGVSMKLAAGLDQLRALSNVSGEMLLVGGGSRGELWRQILADVYQMDVFVSAIGQNAGALGAAAVAALGCGMWSDCDRIDALHAQCEYVHPISENVMKYEKLKVLFDQIAHYNAEIGERLEQVNL